MTAAVELLPILRDLYSSHVTGYHGRNNTLVREPLTDEVLLGHLEGRWRVGTYFDPGDGTVILGVIDLDNKEDPEGERPHAKRAAEALADLGLSAEIFTSKGKGYHVPVYFAGPVPAHTVNRVLAYAATKAGRPRAEIFPKQDRVDVFLPPPGSKDHARVGSYINLPFHGESLLAGRTALLNKANGLDPFPDQVEGAAGIKKNSAEDLAAAFAMIGEEAAPETTPETTTEFDPVLLADALRAIPADPREHYVAVHRAVKLSAKEAGFPATEAKEIVRAWAQTSAKYEAREFERRWEKDFKRKDGKLQRIGTVYLLAAEHGWLQPGKFSVEDFYAFMPMHNYVFLPTREYWPGSSVNAQVLKKKMPHGLMDASAWLDRHRHVEQVTWFPGAPDIIEDKFIAEGGWGEHRGVKVLNRYRPAPERGGDPAKAGPWREHLARIYPEEHEHLERWLAHRVQRPGEKINHGMILGGAQGIGKDTILVPVKRAVGDWNLSEVSPTNLVESFDGWKESVILCVSEARDLGGNDLTATNRYSLYEHMKTLTAAPPDVLRVNVKHVRQYYIPNVVGVVITTNHRDGVYLPPDDRRFFVAWSETTKEDLPPGYFKELYSWYEDGGADHVAAYLAALDLSDFNPKAPPPWTAAKTMMVDAGRDENLSPIGDALATIKATGQSIDAVTINDLVAHVESEEVKEMMTGLKSARRVPHLMEAWGYVKVVNEAAKDGKWVVKDRRQPIYAKRELSHQARLNAARALERAKEPF